MRKRLIEVLMILAGTFILAVSVEMFILPYNILSGGVAGLAVALEPFFHIDKLLFANVAMIILFLTGSLVLGKDFARNTLISSFAYPVFTTLISRQGWELTIDPLLASFYGGLLGGIGIGIVMRQDASTGGLDIPPLIIHKLTGVRISTLVMITDALTVMAGIIAYGFSAALLGLISVMSSGFAIQKIVEAGGGVKVKNVQILSDKWEEINARIPAEIDRGTTLLDCQGGFTSTPRKMILCVVSGGQYRKLTDLIEEIDPHAFVIITDTSDMKGEGFTYSSPNI